MKKEYPAKLVVGFMFIIIGIIILLGNLDILDFNVRYYILNFPFFFTLFGLYLLIKSEKKLPGIIITFLGSVWYLERVYYFFNFHSLVLPGLLVIIGIYILVPRNTKSKNTDFETLNGESSNTNENKTVFGEYSAQISADIVNETALFSSNNKIIKNSCIKGGSIVNVIASTKIKFENCSLASENQFIEITSIIGSVELSIPADWNIKNEITPILGSVGIKDTNSDTQNDLVPKTLVLKGVIALGECVIRRI